MKKRTKNHEKTSIERVGQLREQEQLSHMGQGGTGRNSTRMRGSLGHREATGLYRQLLGGGKETCNIQGTRRGRTGNSEGKEQSKGGKPRHMNAAPNGIEKQQKQAREP